MSAAFERGWAVPESLQKVEGVAYVPTYFTDAETRKIHMVYGDAKFYYEIHPIDGHVGTTYTLNDDTPYDYAMRTLREDVNLGKIALERYENAVKALMRGDFDWTAESEYLPGNGQV